ncbi:MAG: MBG domain-containing protein [Candidatus Paceibacterota bacterium]
MKTGRSRRRRLSVVERLESRMLLSATGFERIELRLDVRDSDDVSLLQSGSRSATVDVGEAIDLEVSYNDLRRFDKDIGAFTVFADIFSPNAGSTLADYLEPIVTETQVLEVSGNFREGTGGNIDFQLDAAGSSTYSSPVASFADDPTGEIANALVALGYSPDQVQVTRLPEELDVTDPPLEFRIRYLGNELANQDLPDLMVDASGVTGATVATQVLEIPALNQDGSVNSDAIPFNIDTRSRTFNNDHYYNLSNSGSFGPDGFDDVGGVGQIEPFGIPGFTEPFDAFSVSVRLTQPVQDLVLQVDPPDTAAAQILLYPGGEGDIVHSSGVLINTVDDPLIAGDDRYGLVVINAGANPDGDDNGDPPVANQPPTANAGQPYEITVGEDLALDASGSSDPDGDDLTFGWDLTGNGEFTDATGESPTLDWDSLVGMGIDGPGEFEVAVEADDGSATDVAMTTLTVDKATPIVEIDWSGGTYNGGPFAADGSVIGFDGAELATPTFTYFVGADTDGTQLAAAPVDAGTYAVQADYAGDANHTAASATATITIEKAIADIVVDGTTMTYDGNPHGATGSATGAAGENLTGQLNLGESFTNAPGGTANWAFAGDNNHHADSGQVAIEIEKAELIVDVDDASWEIATEFPVFTGEISGAVNGESFTAEYSSEADETSTVGTYEITAEVYEDVGKLSNYEVLVSKGTLTVDPAEVDLDIRRQSVNIDSNGALSLVMPGASSNFDLAEVDLDGLSFAGVEITTFNQTLADVDGDGKEDLTLHFRMTDELQDALEDIYKDLVLEDYEDDGDFSRKQLVTLELEGTFGEHDQQFQGSDAVDMFFSGRALREVLNDLDLM